MLGLYYSDTWDAKSFPFMSTTLKSADGSEYPSASIFPGGSLNGTALAEFGISRMASTFAYGIFMSNAAVSLECLCEYSRIRFSLTKTGWCTYCPHNTFLGVKT